jgi:hypothetical protein
VSGELEREPWPIGVGQSPGTALEISVRDSFCQGGLDGPYVFAFKHDCRVFAGAGLELVGN